MINQQILDKITANMIDNKHVFGTVLCVENETGSLSLTSSAGNIGSNDQYFIASVTKLYVTALALILKKEKRFDFDQKIEKFFPAAKLEGLHVYKGVDYTSELTFRHLISNTSGIPDYFFGKDANQKSGADELLEGKDSSWTLDKTLAMVKNMQPKFKPGQKGKAEYSDTNYQLLGCILEIITEMTIVEAFQTYLFDPLGLQETYTYSDPEDQRPVPMRYQDKILQVPQYMASIGAEGGIVSTARECMIFLKAFFNRFYFDLKELDSLKQWNFMLRPATMHFGIGLEKLWTPWFISPSKPIRNILGFWGQTGSFSFYHQDSGLYFTGTANQINGRGHNAALKAILKIIKSSR